MSRKWSVAILALTLLLALPAATLARMPHATLTSIHVIRSLPAKPVPSAANCTNAPSSPANGGYVFTGWKVQGNKTAYLSTNSIPAGLSSAAAVTASLQASFDAWTTAETAAPDITVTGGGTLTKQAANHQYDLLFGRTSGSSIAVTYTWTWSNGEIESDTVFNKGLSWFLAGGEGDGCYESIARYELRNIATHEFGHTYGLSHPSGARWETMYAYGYTGETLKWSLGAGDTDGVRARYP